MTGVRVENGFRNGGNFFAVHAGVFRKFGPSKFGVIAAAVFQTRKLVHRVPFEKHLDHLPSTFILPPINT